jgi:maltose-binding protein MalE
MNAFIIIGIIVVSAILTKTLCTIGEKTAEANTQAARTSSTNFLMEELSISKAEANERYDDYLKMIDEMEKSNSTAEEIDFAIFDKLCDEVGAARLKARQLTSV